MQRAGLHAGAELHRDVNIGRGSDAVSNDTHCFIHHRDQDTVYNKARTLVYSDRSLAQRSHQVERGLEGLVRGLDRASDLDQLHDLRRVEEVAADHLIRTLDGSRQLGGGQSGGVGSEDRVRRADLIQLLQQVFLEIHALEDNFHNEVSVGSCLAVQRGLERAEQLVLVLLGHLLLLDQEGQVIGDGLDAAVEEFLLDVDHGDVVAVGQENFRDARAHVAGAEYTNFHVMITSLSLN